MKKRELANILDECLERILTRGETIEQCLTSYPEQAAELEPLLQTALVTKKASAVIPRLEFRDRARYQLRRAFQEMALKKEKEPRSFFFSLRPQWAMVVIAVLIMLLAGGGTVAAASNSMPDEPLYPVKLVTETIRLTLTPSTLGKAELYAKLADKRVAEIIKMADKGKPEQVERATERLNRQLVAMASLAVLGREKAGVILAPVPEVAPRELVPAPAEEKEPGLMMAPAPPLTTAEAPTPPGLTEAGEEAEDEEDELDQQAKLKKIVARKAVEHPEALREALKRVPPSARPALLRAIASSDAEYKKILKALEEEEREKEEEKEKERE